MIRYWIWRICIYVWRWLPSKLGYVIASLIADATYLAWRRGRNYARENLSQVLGKEAGEKAIAKTARQSLRNYCKFLVDFMRLPILKPEEIKGRVNFNGWENLDAALQKGKGVILIGLHLGNWELAAAAIALRNYPLNVITETFHPPKLNEIVQRARGNLGMKTIPMENGTMKLVRALRRNEILGLLIDQPCGNSGVLVRFFNAFTRVPAGAATLALKTGAKVIPGGVVRLPNNDFLGFIDPHIPFEPTGDLPRDIQGLTQCIMDSLEKMVTRYPDQWYMFRPMWMKNSC